MNRNLIIPVYYITAYHPVKKILMNFFKIVFFKVSFTLPFYGFGAISNRVFLTETAYMLLFVNIAVGILQL